MTIYTFYRYDRYGYIHLAGTVDSDTGEYTGDRAESLKMTIEGIGLDLKDEQKLLETFYDGERLFIRKGEPVSPLVIEGEQKTPKITFSRSEET